MKKYFALKDCPTLKQKQYFFILKLLIKMVYSFISRIPRNFDFIKIQDCFRLISVKIPSNHNSRQENEILLRYQRGPVKLSHNFAPCD